jgi:hypothetical protein
LLRDGFPRGGAARWWNPRAAAPWQHLALTRMSSPWRRLVRLIDRSLDGPDHVVRMLVEFWRAAMRDDHMRTYSAEVQPCYRAPFLAAVSGLGPVHEADDVTDLVITALAGVITSRAQGLPAPSREGFRALLLAQLQVMLGRPA